MLISDSHEFIFVRVRKTASSSMTSQLEPYLLPRPESRWSRIKSRAHIEKDYRKYRFRAHAEIGTAQRLIDPEQFARYFKFAIVRNPWDRLVSEYEYILKTESHGRHKKVVKLGGFDRFVDMQIPRRDAYQLHALCGRDGQFLMDFVGKLETVDQNWKTICGRIGVPHADLPRKNVSVHRPYSDYYSPQLRDKVAKYWAPEIRKFDYEFES